MGSDECPRCGRESSVIESRKHGGTYMRRRRECDNPNCVDPRTGRRTRWSTVEVPDKLLAEILKLRKIRNVLAQ